MVADVFGVAAGAVGDNIEEKVYMGTDCRVFAGDSGGDRSGVRWGCEITGRSRALLALDNDRVDSVLCRGVHHQGVGVSGCSHTAQEWFGGHLCGEYVRVHGTGSVCVAVAATVVEPERHSIPATANVFPGGSGMLPSYGYSAELL